MKSILLSLCLFISTITLAQWSQVGATQFTNFAKDADLAIHPTNGNAYVVYSDVVNSNRLRVFSFDGTNWLPLGTGFATASGSDIFTMEINPVTGLPWIAYRNNTTNNLDIIRYDGSSWVGESVLALTPGYKLKMQFNSSGQVAVVGSTATINDGTGQLILYSNITGTWQEGFTSPMYLLGAKIEILPNLTVIAARVTGTNKYQKSIITFNGTNWYLSDSLRYYNISNFGGFSAINQNDVLIATFNNKLYYTAQTNGSVYSYTTVATGIQNRGDYAYMKSTTDNRKYIYYIDGSFKVKLKRGFSSFAPDAGIDISSANNKFAKVRCSNVNGNIYVVYNDGEKCSVKVYNIIAPLNKYYVNANVSGGDNSGVSWANACSNLSRVLDLAGSNTTEIWVASGTYKPGTTRSDSFIVGINGLSLYGGFNGTETSLSQRDFTTNTTILSGDINGDDAGHNTGTRGDNSYHIMTVLNADNLIIDGFQLKYGHANGTGTLAYGGAINIGGQTSNLKIKNCVFDENFGLTGGAVRSYLNNNTSMTFENCTFNNNLSRYGSGLYFLVNNSRTVSLNLTNCLFSQNKSQDISSGNNGYTGSAAWIRANDSGANLTTIITNCTFASNQDTGTQSGSERGALALSRRTDGTSTHNVTINNSIFYENKGAGGATTLAVNKGHTNTPDLVVVNNAIDEDNFSNLVYLTNTSNANPLFTNISANNFTLQSGSPAIDAGDNSRIPSGVVTDLLNNQRIHNATVDMGAYEFNSMPLGIATNDMLDSFNLFPNPTKGVLTVNSNEPIHKIEVYTILGKKVLTSNSSKINTQRLANGVYLLKAHTTTNKIGVKRFIKN